MPVRYHPGDALLTAYRRFGAVIDAGIGPLGCTFLLGSEANRFVFASAEAFSWQETFGMLTPTDGPTALMVSDGADHRRRRAVVTPALHRRRIADYVPIMTKHADAAIDAWRPGQHVDAYQVFRAAIRTANTEALFGPRVAAHADALGAHLESLLELAHLPTPVARLRERGRRARAAQRGRDDIVSGWIAQARRNPRTDDNVLAALVESDLSDNEIRDQIVSLIADGYETTSGALAWAIYALLIEPEVWDAAAEEVHRVLGGRPPTAADIDALGYLGGVVHETLRLYTPGVISARKVKQDLTFDGCRIRSGRMLVFSPYVTHRIPELWPAPTEFRPERWIPGHPEYRRPGPHEFIPFSGGLHRCIGSTLATTEMTVMLARLLARTRLRLPLQRIRARHVGALRPVPGLAVEVTRIRS